MKETKDADCGLLEFLARETGCVYLSDLRQPARLAAVRKAVRGLSPGQFSLWEWNDAAAYITEKACDFKTVREAAVDIRRSYRLVLANSLSKK